MPDRVFYVLTEGWLKTGNIPVAMFKVGCFYAVFIPLSTIFGNYLAEDLGWNGLFVTGLNMASNLILEYLYDRFFVFGKTIDTRQTSADKNNGKSQ